MKRELARRGRLWNRIESWLIRVLACGLVLAIASCRHAVPAKPLPASCNATIFVPCTTADGSTTDTGVRWTAAADDAQAFDELGGKVVPQLSFKLLTCEAKRQASIDCLQRLDDAGVIVLTRPERAK